MIFISKKALNDEVDKRMAEINFKNRTDEKIWRLEADIHKLQFRVDCLEDWRESGEYSMGKIGTGE